MRVHGVLIGFVLWCASGAAFAHSALVRAEPGPRAEVAVSPQYIRLWFNEPIEAEFSNVTIIKVGGKAIDGVGKPKVASDDANQLVVPLPPLAPGAYQVRYRVLSVDGHVVDWGFGFTVAPSSPKP
jgi:methionine-rich copper-binding protein CopC